MARRNLQTLFIKALTGGIDYDSDPFEVPEDCVISSSNMLPSLSVGGLSVINGYTVQNPNSPFVVETVNYLLDEQGNILFDENGNALIEG